ncbi:unnamed protein product [Caenorhabditis angaria]|uniref:DUF38 domain-containing protein n=1 Tax=Caenorhabditis angaria TaxID=860376 RepID=A0A9P1N4I3_9PELO|nr:unnamed protein product [Caenorhabditis angaria]
MKIPIILLILITNILCFFDSEEEEELNKLDLIRYSKYSPMAETREYIDHLWTDSPDHFDKKFRFIDHCNDSKIYDQQYFKSNILRSHLIPIVNHVSDSYIRIEWEKEWWRLIDLTSKNNRGQKFGMLLRWKYFGKPLIYQVFSYNCNHPTKLAYQNYAIILKAQKLMNTIWQLLKEERFHEIYQNYFAFGQGFDKPEVIDAILIKRDEVWQFSVKWLNRDFDFQMEDVSDKLKITIMREMCYH